MNFSVNQVRHLYVANKSVSNGTLDMTDDKGTLSVHKDSEHLYFQYRGASGITRSDLINLKDIISAKVTGAGEMERELTSYKVTLASNINSGSPVAEQDYILRIAFRQYVGMSDNDQYFQYGEVHTTSDMTASDFYRDMAISLANNLSKDSEKLLEVSLEVAPASEDDDPTYIVVNKGTKAASLTGTYTGIVLVEALQNWVLGVKSQTPVYFEVFPTEITVNGIERIWGEAVILDDMGIVSNGKLIADLEYFCMGERGDIYRGVGYPHIIRTEYLVDPDKQYDVIDIHYAYVGGGENPQKSEKDITIVVPTDVDNKYRAATLAGYIGTFVFDSNGVSGTITI